MKFYKVGGCVRDQMLGQTPRDVDYVVTNTTANTLLKGGFKLVLVGGKFPIFLHPTTGDEVVLAGYDYANSKDYFADKQSLYDDLSRRDLTINAMAVDQFSGDCIDPFGGQKDLHNRILKHTGDSFRDDPIRVLRVARLAARYEKLGFTIHPDTLSLMNEISCAGELDELDPERVYKELSRAMLEQSPSVFFKVLNESGCLAPVFPEIEALKGQSQPKQHHPEGDVFIHQMMVLEQARLLSDSVDVMIASLCHDFGKGLTPMEKLPHHHGHEKAGVPLVESFCDRLKMPRKVKQLAMISSEYHTHIHRAKEITAKSFLKLLNRFGAFGQSHDRFDKFLLVCEADARGRLGFENRSYDQSDIAKKVLQESRRAVWCKEKLMTMMPRDRSTYIYRERLSRIEKELGKIHNSDNYKKYREKYERFFKLNPREQLEVLILDRAHLHSNYVKQTLAILLIPQKQKNKILEYVNELQKIESSFDPSAYNSIGDSRSAKYNLFLSSIAGVNQPLNRLSFEPQGKSL